MWEDTGKLSSTRKQSEGGPALHLRDEVYEGGWGSQEGGLDGSWDVVEMEGDTRGDFAGNGGGMKTICSSLVGKSYVWCCTKCGRRMSYLTNNPRCELDDGEGTWVPDGCLIIVDEEPV